MGQLVGMLYCCGNEQLCRLLVSVQGRMVGLSRLDCHGCGVEGLRSRQYGGRVASGRQASYLSLAFSGFTCSSIQASLRLFHTLAQGHQLIGLIIRGSPSELVRGSGSRRRCVEGSRMHGGI